MLKSLIGAVVLATSLSVHAKIKRSCVRGLAKSAERVTEIERLIRAAPNLEMYTHLQYPGTRMATSAENPAIVILHGAMANSQTYEELTNELLIRGRTVLRVDLVGHGKTLQRSGIVDADFKQAGSYIAGILQGYGIGHAAIYGHSMGAAPAVRTAIAFKEAGGIVSSVLLDDPLVLPLEDYYYEHQEEMVSSKISRVVKGVGGVQMIAGLCLGPLGIPLFTVGACNYAAGKATDMATALFAEVALPVSKLMYRKLLIKKINENPSIYYVDRRLPAAPETIADGAMAAFDPTDMRTVASDVGDTPVTILLGLKNLAIPQNLMKDYVTRFSNARIQTYPEVELRGTQPHLHPQYAPAVVAEAIDRLK